MNVGKGRHFKTLLPYQMKKMERESSGHLSNYHSHHQHVPESHFQADHFMLQSLSP